ncbi:E3 ubiquitin-protein ligase RNF217-like [Montipora capricornis]|uniref:E3 ubiquitin-protein ligase RNF217-like n=1 Tax=Montipora capricornis TaxID=246305 RepID=UPI0035F107B9
MSNAEDSLISSRTGFNRSNVDLPQSCCICLENFQRNRASIHCECDAVICDSCLGAYVRLQITDGKWKLECANCNSMLSKYLIQKSLQGYPLLQEHFNRLVVEAQRDPLAKTCPNCRARNRVKNQRAKQIWCAECHFSWCFQCHAPWHKGLSCKDFKRGSKMFREWTKNTTEGVVNARPCPKCKVFIQRSEGCDHMSCPRCRTQFCYLCGDRIITSKLFGGHWSIYSVLGCKYIYKKNNPLQRKVVRGCLLGVVLSSLPAIAVAVVAASPVLPTLYLHTYPRKQ